MVQINPGTIQGIGSDEAGEKALANEPRPQLHIEPTKGWASINLKELWLYRELIYYFVWRDLKVRYKQTVMGALWAILQPFIAMVIFSLFFGRLAKLPSEGIPYPIFSYSALVPWTFFANGVTQASNILVLNQNMVKKIYFPRLTMPIASVISGVVDFFLAFVVLLGMMVVYRIYPTANIICLPLLLLLALVTCLGVSFWSSAMNAQFRDIRYAIPFIVQVWFFLTPIVYSSSMLPEPWRTLYGINPMAGVVEGFRWALLGTDTQPGSIVFLSAVVAVILFISGAYYFRRMERTYADIV